MDPSESFVLIGSTTDPELDLCAIADSLGALENRPRTKRSAARRVLRLHGHGRNQSGRKFRFQLQRGLPERGRRVGDVAEVVRITTRAIPRTPCAERNELIRLRAVRLRRFRMAGLRNILTASHPAVGNRYDLIDYFRIDPINDVR